MNQDLLRGVFDMHVHSHPDVAPRKTNDVELAQRSAEAGMGGLLLKAHHGSTVERAYLVQQMVPAIRVFGGLVLNYPVGGLNAHAIDVYIRLGAKEVWMPSLSADYMITYMKTQVSMEERLVFNRAHGAASSTVGHKSQQGDPWPWSRAGRGITIFDEKGAHCAFTMREDWAKILKRKKGRMPDFTVFEISEYLANEIKINTEDLKPVEMSVTYHDPCYLNRGLGVSKEPRELLAKIPGLTVVEMEKADRCCGGGGEVKDGAPQFAQAIAAVKAQLIQKTGAEAVVTGCPHCVEQIVEVSSASGASYGCLNIVELLSRSYRG